MQSDIKVVVCHDIMIAKKQDRRPEPYAPSSILFLSLFLIYTLHQIHDFLVAGTNFLNGDIVVDDINNTCKILAHVCFYVVRSGQKLRDTVVQVGGDNLVDPAFLIVSVKFIHALSEQTVSGADKYTVCVALLDLLATSSILSPEEIISSIMTTSLPSTETPRNTCATIGF